MRLSKRKRGRNRKTQKNSTTKTHPDSRGGKRRGLPPQLWGLAQHLHVGPQRRLAHAVGVEVEGVLVEVRKVSHGREEALERVAQVARGDCGRGSSGGGRGDGGGVGPFFACRRRLCRLCDGALGRGQRGVPGGHLVPHTLHLDQRAPPRDVPLAAEPRGDALSQRQQRRGPPPVDEGRRREERRGRLRARVPVAALRGRGVQRAGCGGRGRASPRQHRSAGELDVGGVVPRRLARCLQC